MGAVACKAVSGIGSVLGSASVAPIKAIFGRSCEGICSGTWDFICFIEHICIASLVRLFIVSVLTYIILLFFYLLFKVGIIQCIGRSFCKMTWAACEEYWTALEDISCFFWHKFKDTKRVYRRRFEDMEEEFSTTDIDPSEDYQSIRVTNLRKSVRDKRKDRMRQSLYPKNHSSLKRRQINGLCHHVRLKTSEVSVHVEGSRRRKKAGQMPLRSREQHIGPKFFSRR